MREQWSWGSYRASLSILEALAEATHLEIPSGEAEVVVGKVRLQRIGNLLFRQLNLKDRHVTHVVVPQNARSSVLDLFHEQGGHFGKTKTFEAIRERFS